MLPFLAISDNENYRLRQLRIFRDRTNPLDSLNDQEIYERYRFSREVIFWLTSLLADDLNSTKRSMALLPVQQILIALRYFATGTFQIVCGDCIGCKKQTARRSIWRATNALLNRRNQFIMFPTEQAADNVKGMFYKVAKMSGVLGCIDGSHIRIQRPNLNEFQFVNRKFYHSINIQAICSANGQFTNIVAAWPGSCHDSRILRESGIASEFENGKHDGVLIGDSGYPCKPWLLTPFLKPKNLSEERYNRAHKKTRVIIEQAFGRWKRRFHSMHVELRVQPSAACKLIVACCVLQNIAIAKNLPDFYDELPNDIEGVEISDYDGPQNGKSFRDHYVSQYF